MPGEPIIKTHNVDLIDSPLSEHEIELTYGSKASGLIELKRYIRTNQVAGIITPTSCHIPVEWYRIFNEELYWHSTPNPQLPDFTEDLKTRDDFFNSDRVFAIRSSAVGEGPSGINSTFFHWINPNDDPKTKYGKLDHLVNRLFFAHNRNNPYKPNIVDPEYDEKETGIVIQQVVGIDIPDPYSKTAENNFFAPALSGVVTVDHTGKPTLRLSVGLGTKTVRKDQENLILDMSDITPEIIVDHISHLNYMDVIRKTNGGVEQIPIPEDIRSTAIAQISKVITMLEEWKKMPQQCYWEFACDDSELPMSIVQSHAIPAEDKVEVLIPPNPKGIVVAESSDTINSGYAQTEFVVVIESADPQTLKMLNETIDASFRRTGTAYTLILPEDLLTSTAYFDIADDETQLEGYAELNPNFFSGASVIIESQNQITDHLSHGLGRGGTHFAELCKSHKKLFLGSTDARLQTEHNIDMFGQPIEEFGRNHEIKVYLATTALSVQPDRKGRFEVLQQSSERKHKASWGAHLHELLQTVLSSEIPPELKPYKNDLTILSHFLGVAYPETFYYYDPLFTFNVLFGKRLLEIRNQLQDGIYKREGTDKEIFDFDVINAFFNLFSHIQTIYEIDLFHDTASLIATKYHDNSVTNPKKLFDLLHDCVAQINPLIAENLTRRTSEQSNMRSPKLRIDEVHMRLYNEEIWKIYNTLVDDPNAEELLIINTFLMGYQTERQFFDSLKLLEQDVARKILQAFQKGINYLDLLDSSIHHQILSENATTYGMEGPGEYPLRTFFNKVIQSLEEKLSPLE